MTSLQREYLEATQEWQREDEAYRARSDEYPYKSMTSSHLKAMQHRIMLAVAVANETVGIK